MSVSQQKETIKDALLKLIESTGMSDRKFSERVGIHYSQLHNYTSGKVVPRLDVIERIQAIYPDFMNERKENKQQTVGIDLKHILTAHAEAVEALKATITTLNMAVGDRGYTIELLKEKLTDVTKENAKLREHVPEIDVRGILKDHDKQIRTILNKQSQLSQQLQSRG